MITTPIEGTFSGRWERYLFQQPNVMGFFAERQGYSFPLSSDPGRLRGLLEEERMRYVLVDEKQSLVQRFLPPVIEAHSE